MALADFGSQLAPLPAVFPEARPSKKDDAESVRWSVRSDGRSGFVFVNNYQRHLPMAAKPGLQFDLQLPSGLLQWPSEPITVPADETFFWPFNFDLGGQTRLAYVTAQPVCFVDDGETRYTVFAQTPGVPTEFAIDEASGLAIESTTGRQVKVQGRTLVQNVPVGTNAALVLHTAAGKKHVIIVLDEASSLRCWKGNVGGSERIVLTAATTLFDAGELRLRAASNENITALLLPSPTSLVVDGSPTQSSEDGLFSKFVFTSDKTRPAPPKLEVVTPAGTARTIKLGIAKVAQQPSDAEFSEAGVWHVSLPPDSAFNRCRILRVRYRGDVARAYVGDRLLTDNFYNGTVFDIGLARYGDAVQEGITIKILPLPKSAPIYVPDEAWPAGADRGAGLPASIESVELLDEREVTARVK